MQNLYIKSLQNKGIEVIMMTGDNEATSKRCKSLWIKKYFANCLPQTNKPRLKTSKIKEKIVAMTGDGINDVPALAQANVGNYNEQELILL